MTYFADVAEDTLEYVRRDLTAPDGAFFSAEDADSCPVPSDDGTASGAGGSGPAKARSAKARSTSGRKAN